MSNAPIRHPVVDQRGYLTREWVQFQQATAKANSAALATGDAKSSYITPDAGQWLQANGQAVSRTSYAALFALIGTTYGSGDGSTTFNVPTGPTSQPYLWIKT